MANQLTPNNPLVQEIRELVKNARTSVAQQVNTQLLSTYWQIGRAIVQADIEGVGKGADAGIGKRLLTVKSPKYEGLLSGV